MGELWLSSLYSYFVALPWRKSALDGADQTAPPGVVHIDVGAAWRGEEAAFRDSSCKTHTSRYRAIFLRVLSHSAHDLHAVLRRTVSRIPSAVSRFFRELSR